MPYEPDKPWERQIGESGQAYEAFAVYREAGKSRTVSAVVKQLGKSRSLLDRWKARWDWEARAAAYDNDIERQAKEQAVKGRKTMLDRHTKIAMQVQTKALQALQRLDVDKMTPKDIKEYIKMATELERISRTLDIDEHTKTEEINKNKNIKDDVVIYLPDDRRDNVDK